MARDYARLGINAVPGSVRRILSGKAQSGEFDFVYAAGLFDYLDVPVATALTGKLFDMTRPGGMIPNFKTGARDTGYMEAFMDWRLICRDHDDIRALAFPPGASPTSMSSTTTTRRSRFCWSRKRCDATDSARTPVFQRRSSPFELDPDRCSLIPAAIACGCPSLCYKLDGGRAAVILEGESVMTRSGKIRWVGCTVVALLVTAHTASSQSSPSLKLDAHGFLIAPPEAMKPAEGGRSITFGDPSKPGIYVTRITWAPGTGSRPHVHDQARYITVLKGTWYVATGPDADVYNPEKMTAVKAGSFIFEPAGGHHYDMAKDEEVIVEILGMGPVGTTSLEPGRGRQQD